MASASSFHYEVNCKIPGCTNKHVDDMEPSKYNDSFRAMRILIDTVKARQSKAKSIPVTQDKPITAQASFPTSAQVINGNAITTATATATAIIITKQEKKLVQHPKKHIEHIPSPLIKADGPKYKSINVDELVEKLKGYYNVSEQLFNTTYNDKDTVIATLKRDLTDINSKFEAVANVLNK